MTDPLLYRLATPADIPYLGLLIEASIRGLQSNDYSPSQIDQSIGTWLGLDTQLVTDQTYFAVKVQQNPDQLPTIGGLAACGGWSRRRTPYGSDHRPTATTRFSIPKPKPLKSAPSSFIPPGPGAVLAPASSNCASGPRRLKASPALKWEPL